MKRFFTLVSLVIILCGCVTGVNWYNTRTISPVNLDIAMQQALDKENIIPVAVLGSGPAGLSAALYTSRAAIYTVVFQGRLPGGQLTTTTYVENWPGTKKMLGSALIDNARKQAKDAGAVMVNDSIECVDFSTWPFKMQTEEGQVVYALSVIIATGATPRKLGVIGEDKYWGRGVTTCAVCDAPFFKNKDVVIVGGGDSAVEEATLLASYARNVTMLVRGDALRASPAMKNRLKDQEKIRILYNTEITEIKGDEETVTGIELRNSKDNRVYTMPIDGVFLAIGHIPNTEIFQKYLSTNQQGYIDLPKKNQSTNIPGVFAAGDVSDFTYRQAGVASGDGIKAGMDAIDFLESHGYNEKIATQLDDNLYDPDFDSDKVKLNNLISNEDFNKYANKKEPLLIEVGADWCASCKAMLPVIQAVASKFEGKVNFAYIDLDDDPKDLVKRFNLKAVPSILIFKNGKLVSRHERKLFSKRELRTLVEQIVSDTEK